MDKLHWILIGYSLLVTFILLFNARRRYGKLNTIRVEKKRKERGWDESDFAPIFLEQELGLK